MRSGSAAARRAEARRSTVPEPVVTVPWPPAPVPVRGGLEVRCGRWFLGPAIWMPLLVAAVAIGTPSPPIVALAGVVIAVPSALVIVSTVGSAVAAGFVGVDTAWVRLSMNRTAVEYHRPDRRMPLDALAWAALGSPIATMQVAIGIVLLLLLNDFQPALVLALVWVAINFTIVTIRDLAPIRVPPRRIPSAGWIARESRRLLERADKPTFDTEAAAFTLAARTS